MSERDAKGTNNFWLISPWRRPVTVLLALALAGLLASSGCVVGPDYHAPATTMPVAYHETATVPSAAADAISRDLQAIATTQAVGPTTSITRVAATAPTTAAALTPTTEQAAEQVPSNLSRWWEEFHDPELNSLISRAINANLSIASAESSVRQSRAVLIGESAPFYPQVNVTGAYTRSHPPRVAKGNDLYQAGLDATWELDVFGGEQRTIEQAGAQLGAAIENKRDVLITVLGEVALDYVQLRGLQSQLAIAENSLKGQENTLDLTESRFKAGLTGELDVANARAVVDDSAATIPTLESQIRQQIHALAVLLALEPGALSDELTMPQPLPIGPPIVPPGLPGELLRRRPDVRLAERQLAAANAGIGAAQSDLYPKFTLNGSIDIQSNLPKGLANWRDHSYSIGPNIVWPLFDAGSIRANIRIQDELAEQALNNYRSTVLSALQNVEDALIIYNKEQVRRAALTAAVRANQRAFDLSNELYEKGLADFLSVLTDEQNLYSAQNQLAASETQIAVDLVSLYKALGGGWEETDTVPSATDKQDRFDTTGATDVPGTTDHDKQNSEAKSAN